MNEFHKPSYLDSATPSLPPENPSLADLDAGGPAEPRDATTATNTADLNFHYLVVSENADLRKSRGWEPSRICLASLQQSLLTHAELTNKHNARAFVPGAIAGDQRRATATSALTALVLDLDKGEDLDVIRSNVRAAGVLAFVYSTHSHMSPTTEIKLDDYREGTGESQPSPDGLRRYLADKKGIDPSFLKSVDVQEAYRDTPDGAVCVASHAPIPKYRVVFPLAKPFTRREFVEKGMSQRDFEATWKAKYAAFANTLGVRWDTACADVARAFFYPSCRPGAPRVAEKIEGTLLNLDAVSVEPHAKPAASTASVTPQHQNTGKAADHRLKAWVAQYGATFEIETALRSRAPAAIFRGGRAGKSGVHIACPFEDTHTTAGGTGTFVVNASENDGRGFAVHCCHDHCLRDRGNGKSVDRLIFLEKMLEVGWLALEDLHDPKFGGGPVRTSADRRSQRHGRRHDLRVRDRDGQGLDVEVFHASVVAPGRLDFERLNALCKTEIASDVTSEQIAEFVESGHITVANLLESYRESKDDDPYESRLLDLARKKGGESLSGHRVDAALDEIRKEFKVKQKTMEKDFKDAERTVQERLSKMGLLSAEETLLVPGLREYTDRFAIIRTGGKALVFDLQEPNLSQALMHSGDFQLAYRKEWFEVADANGGRKTIYPAEEFLRKPPKATKVYHGGFVFKPAGTVPANQFNLYRGMLIEPNSSGSCSRLHDLIREVWTPGDPAAKEWVLEWLMHIIARPGERADTSIAIRGGYGDGKSFVFAKLLKTILGEMLITPTNEKLILGDYNEALMGKLVVVLPEAAFASGAARFVHDALNHSFRRMQGRARLVINTVHQTEVAIRQIALSRSPVEQCLPADRPSRMLGTMASSPKRSMHRGFRRRLISKRMTNPRRAWLKWNTGILWVSRSCRFRLPMTRLWP